MLTGVAAGAGLAIGSNLLPSFFRNTVKAQAAEKPALLMVFLEGGYNAMFSNGDVFMNQFFGVTSGNTQNPVPGSGVVIDSGTFGTMSNFAKTHMANIGVRHGISNHGDARVADVHFGARSAPLMLANALGGTAAVKAALLGDSTLQGNHPAEGTATLQRITDMQTTLDQLGASQANPNDPDRTLAAKMIGRSKSMSAKSIESNTRSLGSLRDAYPTTIASLNEPVQPFNFTALSDAYQLNNATAVNRQRSKFAAAELMIRAGATVAVVEDGGWDSHGDQDGNQVRNQMNAEIMPGLNTFINRMVNPAGAGAANRNVVVVIMGDFARSLPGSDHAPLLSTTVIGKYVKSGSSGKVQVQNSILRMPEGTPSINQFWAYLAAVTKAPNAPFGANPHSNLVL